MTCVSLQLTQFLFAFSSFGDLRNERVIFRLQVPLQHVRHRNDGGAVFVVILLLFQWRPELVDLGLRRSVGPTAFRRHAGLGAAMGGGGARDGLGS